MINLSEIFYIAATTVYFLFKVCSKRHSFSPNQIHIFDFFCRYLPPLGIELAKNKWFDSTCLMPSSSLINDINTRLCRMQSLIVRMMPGKKGTLWELSGDYLLDGRRYLQVDWFLWTIPANSNRMTLYILLSCDNLFLRSYHRIAQDSLSNRFVTYVLSIRVDWKYSALSLLLHVVVTLPGIFLLVLSL